MFWESLVFSELFEFPILPPFFPFPFFPFPQHFILKHTENRKEFFSEYAYIRHLESTINILLMLIDKINPSLN